MELVTQNGQPASIIGLAGNSGLDAKAVAMAFEAGVNYFFFYNLEFESLLEGLKSLIAGKRKQILVATGYQERDISGLRAYFDSVRRCLNLDEVDVFFVEYVSPDDDMAQVQAILDELYSWQEKRLVRYVGVTTHNRSIALELINLGKCQVLMHRYNMAHRKVEEDVLPSAQRAGIPVVAFTCTRWGTLLQGHPHWQQKSPTAADCYRYVLHQKAVSLALTAPQNLQQLEANLSVLNAPPLTPEEIAHWQAYGNLIYGTGQDAFETQWV
ncbi:MAG: aldo/keto reductase [Chlorogloeopsis fritschii C42_A2020_084]|uniref:aldo/keto reductase n=1 Tax=Chlorogloeopsis fritschii TaxID=1124 RepID=UPI0019F402D3|nr:aldo/keto reductase [Chlorogloeopsis fritschii]MBF2005297.1 aldo/keto reductase [Chlorogloeopsis fritschii C42_A2020_084]